MNYNNILNRVITMNTLEEFDPRITSLVKCFIPLLMPNLSNSYIINNTLSVNNNNIINKGLLTKNTNIYIRNYVNIIIPKNMVNDISYENKYLTKGLEFYITFVNNNILKPIILRRKD